MNIDELIKKQRDYFKTHQTKNISFRINKLNELKKTIKENETQISEALQKDLGKCETESYMTEIGITLNELFIGEKIADEQYKAIADNNLLDALENSSFTF